MGEYPVLVVADECETLDRVERALATTYTVTRVGPDEDVFDHADEFGRSEVVLFERSLPIPAGDQLVLESQCRAGACFAAIVDGLDPTERTVSICREAFLDEPIDESALRESVSRLRRWARYDEKLAECASLAERRAELETTPADVERDSEYETLCERLECLRREVDDLRRHFDAEDFRAAFETPDFAGGARLRRVAWL
ncbi:HalX domain-containing protein [Natronobiforma cellulositropha]|uniref:HalX domain-containing protein n=1 Tax=Natronobiforma cellulositropha TaxID=1679076 RepID=UPI0021D5FB05|nr:HalX domain-containing protein [Natronobiforma cellulositropha]